MKTTATDVLDLHVNLLPVELTMDKVNFNVVVRLCTLPETHPLHVVVRKAAGAIVNSRLPTHPSPIHCLIRGCKRLTWCN